MKKLTFSITLFCVLSGKLLFAQSSQVIRQYIDKYKGIAIEEEVRTGVPAAITLAQGIHETSAGTSDLVLASNNHFGIKCKTEWTGPAVYHDDDAKGECFRKYDDPRDSYRDHSDFLKNRPYYASLFKLDPTDYEGWAFGLKKAGYATNPRYPQILIKLIQDYNLQEYTLIALGRKSDDPNQPQWASTSNPNNNQTEAVAATKEENTTDVVMAEKTVYPSGQFSINSAKVIFIEKGTAFLKVAEDYHISLPRLFEFNDMAPVDIAAKDQLVFLQRKRKTGATEFHMVKPGETTYDIAQAEGIRLESLLDYNFLKAGMQPLVGERIYLSSKAPSMPRLVSYDREEGSSAGMLAMNSSNLNGYNQDEFILHVVQPRETVYAIAKKYSVGINDVMKWNDLQSNGLKTGQQLRINKRILNATN